MIDKIQKKNKLFYERYAKAWAATKTDAFWHERQFRKFIKYLKQGDSVIDIGCAYGIHVPLFLGVGRHLKYEGLDFSKSMLKLARSRYPQLRFYQTNILDRKTLPKKKYHAFWAGAVLMHVPEKDWPKMIKNLEAVIKGGGYGYMSLPQRIPAADKAGGRHFSLFDKIKVGKILKKHDWKILESGFLGRGSSGMEWYWYVVRLPK